MPNAERDVVKAPNEEMRGDRRANGFMPLTESASPVRPPNEEVGGTGAHRDRRGGSADLAGGASPITLPDHKFKLEDAKMPQPPSAFEPGKAAVPVQPFVPGGQGVNTVYPQADSADWWGLRKQKIEPGPK